MFLWKKSIFQTIIIEKGVKHEFTGLNGNEIRAHNSNNVLDIHPFVKWAGGKTQLLDIIKSHLPKENNRYFEPFVGGGALLFKLQTRIFFINEMNSELISVYIFFKDYVFYNELKEKLNMHEKNHSEDYYYQIRN